MTRGLRYAALLGIRSGVGFGPGRRSPGIMVVSALSVAAVAFLGLVAVSVVGVADAQAEVVAGRGLVDRPEQGAPATARAAVLDDWFGDRSGTRVVIWASGTSPSIPGAGALPVGGCAISPALRQHFQQYPAARSRFCAGEVAVIDRHGLTDPDELIGYTVRDASAEGGLPFVGFGPTVASEAFAAARVSEVESSVKLAVLLILPMCAVLLAACVRASTRRRERRIATLRLLGATAAQIAVLLTAEVLVIGAPGLVLAAIAHRLLIGLGSGRVAEVAWYTSDAGIGLAGIVVPAAVLAVAVGASILPSAWSLRHPLRARRTVVVRSRVAWCWAAQAALIVLWWLQTLGPPPPTLDEARPRLVVAVITLWIQMLLLPVFVARTSRWFGERLGTHASGVAGHLGGRLLGSSPPIGRQLGGCCVAAVLLGTTAFYGAGLVGSVSRSPTEADSARPFERAITVNTISADTADRLGEVDGIDDVLRLRELVVDVESVSASSDGTGVTASSAMVGSCGELSWYLGLGVDCAEPLAARVRTSDQSNLAPAGSTSPMRSSIVASPVVAVTSPEQVVDVPAAPSVATAQNLPSVVIDERILRYPDDRGLGAQIVPSPEADPISVDQQIRSIIDSTSTGVIIESPASLAHAVNRDLRRYLWTIGAIGVSVAGLLVLLVLVGIADGAQTMRATFGRLAMAGAMRDVRARTAAMITAVFAVCSTTTTAVVVWLANSVIGHLYPDAVTASTWNASLTAAAAAVVLVVTAVGVATLAGATRAPSLVLERSE